MLTWALQDCGDHAPLVLRRDGRMSPFADGEAENSFFNKERKLKRVEQPFKKVRRAKMGDCETRPIENLLSDEGVSTRIAFRIAISRPLRQIDDGGDGRFLRGLREIDGCIDKPRLDRVD
jgi:hypothetical protein